MESKLSSSYLKVKKERPELIIWEAPRMLVRFPMNEEEHDILNEQIIESYSDSFRFHLYSIPNHITKQRISYIREWEVKTNNRWAAYDYETGEIAATFRSL